MSRKPLVIFAEDDNEDWMLIEDTLDQCSDRCRTERVKDGEALINRLNDLSRPLPDVIMMDLKMPKKNGIEALADIRANQRIKHIPVIMMTTSKMETDVMESYLNGVNSYVIKPVTFKSMHEVLTKLHDYWLELATLPQNV